MTNPPNLNFIDKLCSLAGFTEEEAGALKKEYNDNLNLNLLRISGISKIEIDQIKAGLSDPNQLFIKILEKIKDKPGLKDEFEKYCAQYHQKLFESFLNNANEEQKQKIQEYLQKLSSTIRLGQPTTPPTAP